MSLTKKDWNGITVLLVLIALALVAPYVYQWFRKDSTINVNEFNAAIAQLNKTNKLSTLNDADKRQRLHVLSSIPIIYQQRNGRS
jgi:hypothetical protein